jgi:hypothetical protein
MVVFSFPLTVCPSGCIWLHNTRRFASSIQPLFPINLPVAPKRLLRSVKLRPLERKVRVVVTAALKRLDLLVRGAVWVQVMRPLQGIGGPKQGTQAAAAQYNYSDDGHNDGGSLIHGLSGLIPNRLSFSDCT